MSVRAKSRESKATGLLIRIRGSVLDVEFGDTTGLPELNEALLIELDGRHTLIAEVHEHLDLHTVRAVAMQNTGGLQRGTPVKASGKPILVPVSEKVLGRLINVVGEPLDRLGELGPDVPGLPIHCGDCGTPIYACAPTSAIHLGIFPRRSFMRPPPRRRVRVSAAGGLKTK